VRNTDSRHCAGKAAQDHILAVDTHINFPIERTTERSWRGRSPYLSYNRLLLAGPTCRGPAQCKRSPWSIKGRVHPLEHKFFLRLSQGLDPQTVHKHTQAIQHSSGRRVLRSGGPNHSKSSRLSRVHPPFDQALLGLPQTLPKLGLGGCVPPLGWRFPPTGSKSIGARGLKPYTPINGLNLVVE
jgi:hypothetical protein